MASGATTVAPSSSSSTVIGDSNNNQNSSGNSVTNVNKPYPQQQQQQQQCQCFARLPFLATGAPSNTDGGVKLVAILSNGDSLMQAWAKSQKCRRCISETGQLHLFYIATQKQLVLYEAAAAEFGLVSTQDIQPFMPSPSTAAPRSPPSTPTLVKCVKSLAFLGNVPLDNDEATALGRAILSKAYADFVVFLHQLRMAFRRMPQKLPIDNLDKTLHDMTLRLLKCITKTRPGQDSAANGGHGD